MSCGVGRRHGLDPELLWFWCRLVATAPVRPLAWELPYAAGVALEDKKTKKKDEGGFVVTQQLTNPTRIHEDPWPHSVG